MTPTIIITITITAACFLAAVLNLAIENRFRSRITGLFMTFALVAGIFFYAYGFLYATEQPLQAVLRALLAVCRMFSGVNDLASIQMAPLFDHNPVLILFWAAHFMAFYVTASTAIAAIGGKMLQRIRVTRLRRGTLLIIYGINANSVEYGRRQINALHRSVVFIGQGDSSLESAVSAAGGVIEKNGEQPDGALLRRLGIRPGKRRVDIAALHEDCNKNLIFAHALLDAFEAARIQPEQTTLLVQGVDEDQAGSMIHSDAAYGYGNVMAFDEYELAARLMVRKLPPCDTIRFDEKGRALEDFNVLMIGFGRMGHAVLRQLLMNGQFCGSTFHADIFDAKAQNGILHDHEMLRQYDIRFHAADGKSDAFYAFLNACGHTIRYIALCTGSAKENRELARDLAQRLKTRGAAPAIVQCTAQCLVLACGDQDPEYQRIYGSEAMDIEPFDRMAMRINHTYCTTPGKAPENMQKNTPQENWKHCNYFGRMSSRASADFYPAVLRAAGKTTRQVLDGDWPPQEDVLENLSITEHLRWCAFHYVMGYQRMSEDEYAERTRRYQAEMQEKGESRLRIGKDGDARKHACLIPWEDLDALSARENAITGQPVDYKQQDRNNVLALPNLLRELDEAAEENTGGRSA